MATRWLGIVLVALVATVPGHPGTGPRLARQAVRVAPPMKGDGDPLPPGALWQWGSSRLVAEGPISFLEFASDGKSLISGTKQAPLTVWDVVSGKRRSALLLPKLRGNSDLPLEALGLPNNIHSMFSESQKATEATIAGQLIAFFDDHHKGHLVDVKRSTILHSWPVPEPEPVLLALTEKGLLAWTTSKPGVIVHWHPLGKEPPVERKVNDRQIVQLAVSNDGTLLATEHDDRSVWLSLVKTGKRLRRYEVEAVTNHLFLGFSRDGKSLIRSDQSGLRVFDVDSMEERYPPLQEAGVALAAVAWVEPGKSIATLHQDRTIHVWDLATGKSRSKRTLSELKLEEPNANATVAFAVSNDEQRIATSSGLGHIQIWDGRTGKPVLPRVCRELILSAGFHQAKREVVLVQANKVQRFAADRGEFRGEMKVDIPGVNVARLSDDGSRLALGGAGLATFDLNSGKRLPALALPKEQVIRFLLFPDGNYILVNLANQLDVLIKGGSGTSQLFDVSTGKHQVDLPSTVWAASFFKVSGNGRSLFWMQSHHPSVQRWELATGMNRPSLEIAGRMPLDVSPDEQRLILSSGQDLFLADTTQPGHILPLTLNRTDSWSSAVFSPDGEWLVGLGTTTGFTIWEARTGRRRVHRRGPQRRISTIAFSRTGKEFLTASDDGTLIVWNMAEVLRQGLDRPASLPPVRPMATLWAELAGNATQADKAIHEMARSLEAERFLAQHLKPVATVTPALLDHLIADLDADTAAVRDAAEAQLAVLGEQAFAALQRAAKGKPTEARRRAARLLARHRPFTMTGLQARPLRAIEVLELIGTPAARRLLATLASGASESAQTREAKAALARLRSRLSSEP